MEKYEPHPVIRVRYEALNALGREIIVSHGLCRRVVPVDNVEVVEVSTRGSQNQHANGKPHGPPL